MNAQYKLSQVSALRLSAPHQSILKGRARFQAGFTLMETMISLALSLVVTSAMVALMANSLGSTSRIIQMTQLTDQLRNTMSMLTRDIRRANYSANAAYCYANADCGADGSANQFADVTFAGNTCFTFGLDRDWNGSAAEDDAGGFRRVTSGGVGVIEMWVGDNAPDCSANNDADWVAVTDPDFVNITVFSADDDDSFSASFTGEAGSTITQRTRQVQVQIEGNLVRDNRISRRIEDVIKLRNDMITKT
jgi:type IV pilus assembly protein PilW